MIFKPLPDLTSEQIEYFWRRVLPANANGCRMWSGNLGNRLYGRVSFNGELYFCNRIVALLTHGKPKDNKQVARHAVCENPPCCEPSHIEWGTHSQNVQDTIGHGRPWAAGNYPNRQRGEYNPNNKLKQNQVDEIRALRGLIPQRELASLYNIQQGTVSKIQNGLRW